MTAPGSGPQDPIVARLHRLHPKVIDLSLTRLLRLLARLDDPQVHTPPVIHVAGTNGKGSVCAFLRAGLEAMGLRVHVFSSPYLVRYNEMIRLSGTLISQEVLTALLDEIEQVNGDRPITFFEVTVAAAFLAFSRFPADAVILEVGLGGKTDATNVIDHPATTVITPVDYDHATYLGSYLPAIATEKAGILKPGVPCAVATQAPMAQRAILDRAMEIGAPLVMGGRDWSTESVLQDIPPPALPGAHQRENLALARIALNQFAARTERLQPGSDVIRRMAREVKWPARMQRLAKGKLVASLPKGVSVYLDGGHNPHAARAISATLQTFDQPVDVICGMMASKDNQGFFAALCPAVRRVICVPVRPDLENALPPEQLKAQAEAAGFSADAVFTCESVEQALGVLVESSAPASMCAPKTILICGSLYLAGGVLRANGTPPN